MEAQDFVCHYNDLPEEVGLDPRKFEQLVAQVRGARKQPAFVLAYKTYASLVDRAERALREHHKTPCRKGCSVCCRVLPPMYPIEHTVLAREVRRAPQTAQETLVDRASIALDRLQGTALALTGTIEISEEARDNYGRQGGVCPLLTASGACMFYNVRPLWCRLWSVVDEQPCAAGESRHRAVGIPAVWALGRVLALSGAPNYTPINSIQKALGK